MKQADLTNSSADSKQEAMNIVQTEEKDAVNTGIVDSVDKTKDTLKGEALSNAKTKTVVSSSEKFVKSAMKHSKINIKTNEKQKQTDVKTSKKEQNKFHLKREISTRATNKLFEDSELEGADDIVYSGKDAVTTAKRLKTSKNKSVNYKGADGATKKKASQTASAQSMRNQSMSREIATKKAQEKATQLGISKMPSIAVKNGSKVGVVAGASASLPIITIIVIIFALIVIVSTISSALGNDSNDELNDISDVEYQVMEYYLAKGLDPIQIAGIMGNIAQESGFDPAKKQSGGPGHGLFQHGGDGVRLEGLFEYAKSEGKSWTDVKIQLDYAWSEKTGGSITKKYGESQTWIFSMSTFKNLRELYGATSYFSSKFLRPGIPMMTNRYANARMYYNILTETSTPKQAKVISVIKNNPPGGSSGMCQKWVADVIQKAGYGRGSACCAQGAYIKYGVSKDKSELPVGATVYGSGSGSGGACHRPYGHVGIYIGGGKVAHCINSNPPTIESLKSWTSKYGWWGWGWENNVDLTKK